MKYVLLLSIFFASTGVFSAEKKKSKVTDVLVTEKGFEPSTISAKAGESIVLKVTRKTEATCATQIKIPSKKITKELPLNEVVTIELGRVEKGKLKFACGMNMIDGAVLVE